MIYLLKYIKVVIFHSLYAMLVYQRVIFQFPRLEALIYLDDLGTPWVSTRPGAVRNTSAFGALGSTPRLRSQNTGHISFYFKAWLMAMPVAIICQYAMETWSGSVFSLR